MKEVNVKRLHIVWCQPYDILEKENYGNSRNISGVDGKEECDEYIAERRFIEQWK